jgi:hypothetical protein
MLNQLHDTKTLWVQQRTDALGDHLWVAHSPYERRWDLYHIGWTVGVSPTGIGRSLQFNDFTATGISFSSSTSKAKAVAVADRHAHRHEQAVTDYGMGTPMDTQAAESLYDIIIDASKWFAPMTHDEVLGYDLAVSVLAANDTAGVDLLRLRQTLNEAANPDQPDASQIRYGRELLAKEGA